MSSQVVSGTQEGRTLGWVDRLARTALTRRLAGLTRGEISLDDSLGVHTFGGRDDLHCSIRVHTPRFFREAVLGGKLSVAETYVRGDWDCDNLTSLFRIFIRNTDTLHALDRGVARFAGITHRIFHWLRDNTPSGSRKNIGAHYDLGNNFFRLWLDETLAYSSGIFTASDSTLYDASVEKMDRCCRKLGLNPREHLLEIGSGWGGMAIHAASEYGCRVTTTTISQEQFDAASNRVKAQGLNNRVRLLKQDYRELTVQFDKLVSIEMIEAVGHRYLDTYFRKCGELLKPDGSMVVQAIVMPERRYAQYTQNVDFIQRYIFPGGCLPSMAAILKSVGQTSDLRFVHAEDFAPHYAETLRRWRQCFVERLDEISALGYSKEFIRLWTYYLCYCEAAFEERHIGVMQVQFDKPQCRRDPIQISQQAAVKTSCSNSEPKDECWKTTESVFETGACL